MYPTSWSSSQLHFDIVEDVYTNETFTVKAFRRDTVAATRATPHMGIRQGCLLSPCSLIKDMTTLFSDVDTGLLATGVRTNTCSIGKPVYGIEYAVDSILHSITPAHMEQFLKMDKLLKRRKLKPQYLIYFNLLYRGYKGYIEVLWGLRFKDQSMMELNVEKTELVEGPEDHGKQSLRYLGSQLP